MKIEKVSYQKTYSIGPYLTEKIGLEASITEPSLDNLRIETPEYVLSELKKTADEWHKATNPHLYQEKGPEFIMPPEQKTPPVIDYGKHDASPEGILSDMDKCQTLKELSSYKLLATNAGLTSQYMNKVKELSK